MNWWVIFGGILLVVVLGLLLRPIIEFVEAVIDAYTNDTNR